MQLNIQTKLFLLLAGLAGGVLFAVLLVVNQTLSDTIQQKIVFDFRQTQTVFQREQRLRYENLVNLASLIGENEVFKRNVDLESNLDAISMLRHASVLQSVREFANLAPVDLFIVTDRKGKMLARLDQPDGYGDDLSNQPSIKRALSGEPPVDSVAQLWTLDGNLYQIAASPVLLNQTNIVGAVVLGQRLTELEAKSLKGTTNIDIIFFLNDAAIATTLDSSRRLALNRVSSSIDAQRAAIAGGKTGESFEMKLAGDDVFAFLAPLGSGEPAYYLAVVKKSEELRILTTIQRSLLVAAALSLVVTIALAVLLGRVFSRPVLALADAMSKVRKGDLAISVQPSSQDEIGQLATAFNEMIVGLRERFQLARYVGSHTLEMVKQAAGGDMKTVLGGTRQDLAVLFSDIRGFTAFSENRSPEAVIEMLNKYLGFQAELVAKFGGSVDKYVGDEMVALFSGRDALQRAIDCAVAIQRKAREVQRVDPAPVAIGIGINYGTMVLGNMGAQDRMDYTVIGSSVNLCARLCSSAKGGQILIRQDLLRALPPETPVQRGETKQMLFKGFSSQLDIAEVLYD